MPVVSGVVYLLAKVDGVSRVIAVDVSDLAAPRELGRESLLRQPTGTVRGGSITSIGSGHVVAIVGDNLEVLDISSPADLSVVERLVLEHGGSTPLWDGEALIVFALSRVVRVSFADPTAAMVLETLSYESDGSAVVDRVLLDGGVRTLTPFGLRDFLFPDEMRFMRFESAAVGAPADVSMFADTAYVATSDAGGIVIYSLCGEPERVHTVMPGVVFDAVEVDSAWLVAHDADGGVLRVFDRTDPNRPNEVVAIEADTQHFGIGDQLLAYWVGDRLFTLDLGADPLATPGFVDGIGASEGGGVRQGPVTDGETVYVGSGRNLVEIDARDPAAPSRTVLYSLFFGREPRSEHGFFLNVDSLLVVQPSGVEIWEHPLSNLGCATGENCDSPVVHLIGDRESAGMAISGRHVISKNSNGRSVELYSLVDEGGDALPLASIDILGTQGAFTAIDGDRAVVVSESLEILSLDLSCP